MRSLEEAMVRSCHTGTAVAAGGRGGAKGSYAGHHVKKSTSETQHKHEMDKPILGAFCTKKVYLISEVEQVQIGLCNCLQMA